MTQIEQIHAHLLAEGYGDHSRDITIHLSETLLAITSALEDYEPNDVQLAIKVEPKTEVTLTIKSI